jgi:uncharacterized protein YfaS (alpha-2-macroglobulin family)
MIAALPAGSQRNHANFSLSTGKTFLPGDPVSVNLYANGVESIEYRVYKVNDPAKFFEHLASLRNFGSSQNDTPEQIDAPTALETFHDWKRELRLDIRNFFREQYSAEVRDKRREQQEPGKPPSAGPSPAASATAFAQVPLLNNKQLVARWRREIPRRFYSGSEPLPLPPGQKGVFLVEATNGELRAFTIAIVTELGVITKTAPGQVLAFVADRRTGAPVPNAQVILWADKKELNRLESDSSGMAESSPAGEHFEDVRVLAIHDSDVAIVNPYASNLNIDPQQALTGYVYTDRPVYRPGHTVYFRALLRRQNGERYQSPAGEQIQVKIEDPSSKEILQKAFTVSAFGSIHGELQLSDAAALGYYSISAGKGAASSNISGGFHVEEYKKPEYEVKVFPGKTRILQGENVSATIEAKYYFGEPVAGAKVTWVVHTSQFWSPYIDREEEDDDSDSHGSWNDMESPGGEDYSDDGGYDSEQLSEQSGKLDANGKLTIQIPTKPDKKHRDLRYRIEARVTDEANREISGRDSFLATYGSFQVGVSPESYVYQKGQTITAIAVAKDYDGHPVRTPLRVELVQPHWDGKSANLQVISSADATTAEDGTAKVTFNAVDNGSYFLRVIAQTPEKREVTAQSWLWVSSSSWSWSGGDNRRIQMVADKKSYQPGDTAHILVMTGVPDAWLLVTTEGRTVRSKRIVRATSSTITLDVPVTSTGQPNFFVGVAFLRDGKIYQSSKNMKVPAEQQKLQLEIQPSKKQYLPGEKASYTLLARDSTGQPVAGEFSLGVVDESVYAIRPDTTQDPQAFFYSNVYDGVSTDSSLSFYFSGHAGTREIFLAGNKAGKRALAQLKPAAPDPLVQPKVRKNFSDTAFWSATLTTDSSGRATTQFIFPDSLTTWRATVRGFTLDTKAGSAVDRVIVRKNVMVRLAVPRFFRQGDEVTISAIVHNYLPDSKTVRVSLDLTGLDTIEGATRDAEVPSKGDATLNWRVKARNVKEAVLLAKALTNEESDAIELTLPVIPVGVKQADAKSGALSAPEQQEDSFVTLPGNPDLAAPALDISLNSSIAGSIFGALDYLTSYPYGCTEQTMSSFLPNIVVAQAMKDLHLPATVNSPELQKKIRAGMDRLKDYQHEDGGWGWWKDDQSLVFMTAYVVSGLGQARAAGYDVDADSLTKAQNWLYAALDKHANMRPDLQAYVLYALALNNASKPEYLQSSWDKRNDMSTQGLAMLGLALLAERDQTRAKEIAEKLEASAKSDDREAWWPSTYDYFLEFELDDAAETTAFAVRLLSLAKPQSPLLPKAAFWLVNHRNGGYFWDSTKQTAMVVFGLTEYVKASHELDANFKAEVFVNGKQVLSKQFTAADSFNPVQPSVHLTAAQLQTGRNEIRIHKSGPGRLYWSASGSYFSNDKRLIQTNKFSLNITRDYFRLRQEKKDDRIVYALDPLSGPVQTGDLIAVRLTIGGGEWRYLLIEDPIPAGAEFVQHDSLYELKERPSWWESYWTRREFHDDRAAFFQTYFSKKQQYVYLLKIVNPGKFQISPAMVQPMYQPAMLATTDAASLEVK